MNTNCKFCLTEVTGNYCSNCGKKSISNFSEVDFVAIYNHILGNRNSFFSKDFIDILSEHPVGYFPSKNRLIHVMLLTGYLVRVSEERFGLPKDIYDDIAKNIIKESISRKEKIRKITDYIDSKSQLISLEGVDRKYLIIDDVVDVFNSIIKQRFVTFFNQSKKEGFEVTKDFDPAIFWEIACRFAVWGYLFRAVESSAKLSQ